MTRRREQPRFLNITHDVVAASDVLAQSERAQADDRYRRETSLREPAPDVIPAKKPTVKVVRPTTPPAPASALSQAAASLVGRGGRTPAEAPKPFTALYIRPSLPSKVVPADAVVLSRDEWSAVDKLIKATPMPSRVDRQPRSPRRN